MCMSMPAGAGGEQITPGPPQPFGITMRDPQNRNPRTPAEVPLGTGFLDAAKTGILSRRALLEAAERRTE